VTCDSDITFKVKGSKVKVIRPHWLVVLAGQHGHTVMVTYPYEYMTYIVSPLAGLGGGISWRLPAYSLFMCIVVYDHKDSWLCSNCWYCEQFAHSAVLVLLVHIIAKFVSFIICR